MKLLTRAELKDDHQTSLDALHAQEQKISKALIEKTKRLNSIDEEYDSRISAKRAELGAAELDFRRFMAGREEEVKKLEAQRQEALIPVGPILREAELFKAKQQELLLEVERKDKELSEKFAILRSKEKQVEDLERKTQTIVNASIEEAARKMNRAEGMELEAKIKLSDAEKQLVLSASHREETERMRLKLEKELIDLAAERKAIEDLRHEVFVERSKILDEREKLKMARLILEQRYGRCLT